MIGLIQNEVNKMLLKKKMVLIFVFLVVFIGLFAYGEKYTYDKTIARYEKSNTTNGYDWKSLVGQQLKDLNRRMDSPYISKEGIASLQIEVEQLNYFMEHDINPITPSAGRFTGRFMEQALGMFLPLMIVILAADLVSGEFSTRTIKVLLTRAVPRWRILLSKYIALLMMSTLVVLLSGILATVISGMFYGVWGFDEPVATGFRLVDGALDASQVILVSRWQYCILIYSLAWFVAVVISSITLMISVMVTSTSSAIGIVMATLIGGQFLRFLLSDWVLVKYFFVSNLNLTDYLTGSYQQIPGMSLTFSIGVLGAWAVVSLIIGFTVFSKKDVLV